MKITFEQIQPILENVFGTAIELNLQTTKADIEDWDSLKHLELITELEDQFDLSFDYEDIEKIDSVEKIIEIVGKY